MIRQYTRKTKLQDMLDKVRMTQRMLATEIGVEQSALSLWMSGKRMPVDDNINRMAHPLQVDRDHLKATFIAENLNHLYGRNICRIIVKVLSEINEE